MIPVYCLAGFSTRTPRMGDDQLGGQLFRNPFTRRDVLYPNNVPTRANAEIGAEQVAEIAPRPGPKIFTGYSMGARALCIYLRSNPDIDPAENVFVLLANPERKYGGLKPSDYGGPGIPDDTPFRVFDVARQYDFWADYPDKTSKDAAAKNCLAGELVTIFGGASIHGDYSMVRMNDPNNSTYVEGNRTYILAPTFPAPSVRRWWWDPNREALEDQKLRPAIEAGYTRPVPAPFTSIKWYPGGAGFDTSSRRAARRVNPPTWNPFR